MAQDVGLFVTVEMVMRPVTQSQGHVTLDVLMASQETPANRVRSSVSQIIRSCSCYFVTSMILVF